MVTSVAVHIVMGCIYYMCHGVSNVLLLNNVLSTAMFLP